MLSEDIIYIRKMCAEDLDEVARIEAENFSTPWKKQDFAHYLDDPQALFLVAVPADASGKAGAETGAPAEITAGAEETGTPAEKTAEAETGTPAEITAEAEIGAGRTPRLPEKIAGYIGCLYAADEGDITNVSVVAACRRAGIGGKLVQELLRESEQRGCSRIFLEVRRSNEAAIHLYQIHGFQEIGIRKNYYEKPAEDALLMRHEK